MNSYINSLGGTIGFKDFYITWQNQVEAFEDTIPGFFCIGTKRFSLECGEVDQGQPGIYWTVYDEEGDMPRSHTLLQFSQQQKEAN